MFKDDGDDLHRRLTGAMGLPFSDLSLPVFSVREQLRCDGVSLTTLAARLRAWARARADVRRLILSHNGDQYVLVALLKDAPVHSVAKAERELYALTPFQPAAELDVFVVDGEHPAASVRRWPGAYLVHDSSLTGVNDAA